MKFFRSKLDSILTKRRNTNLRKINSSVDSLSLTRIKFTACFTEIFQTHTKRRNTNWRNTNRRNSKNTHFPPFKSICLQIRCLASTKWRNTNRRNTNRWNTNRGNSKIFIFPGFKSICVEIRCLILASTKWRNTNRWNTNRRNFKNTHFSAFQINLCQN